MGEGNILLKPVKELLGMNFYIPDYQRGYRWDAQQANDLLSDIEAFAKKIKNDPDSPEIYCIQPLVTQRRSEDILTKVKQAESIAEVEEYIKGSWDVVDGQQRLTTIFLILKNLDISSEELYSIDYQTRDKSKEFLNEINDDCKLKNIDFYHISEVNKTIKKWLQDNPELSKDNFKDVILNRVHFIWYQLADNENAVSVFTRLNIGKIPLTDSELIKALFLNRSNFKAPSHELEAMQREIAAEWCEIENALQNDEFWLFIHNKEYNKPTRIDYILDYICKNDRLLLYKKENGRGENRKRQKEYNDKLTSKIGNDEHKTFRYFYEIFNMHKQENTLDHDRLNEMWNEIKKCYQVFNEWYHDYRLYHYIGYLIAVDKINIGIDTLVEEYTKSNNKKEKFVKYLKDKIKEFFKNKQNSRWFDQLESYKFDEENAVAKTECAPLLLLHNIETVIQQNEKIVSDSKYNLPNFTKFPFHLYKSESWQVEHIHPNAGVNLKGDSGKIYLMLSRKYLSGEKDLCQKIDDYIKTHIAIDQGFNDLVEEIKSIGDALTDSDKNIIWNYTLLDETTNKEYGNAIFPIKRAFVANKERGNKVKYSISSDWVLEEKTVSEIAFIPPCTKNVFSKSYTAIPRTLLSWTKEDAEAYLNDIKEKLNYYFSSEEDKHE